MHRHLPLLCLTVTAGCVPAAQTESATSQLSQCGYSELGLAVLAAANGANPSHSTVPADLLASVGNTTEAALLEGPQIFPRLADLIAAAHDEVNLVTYVFEKSNAFTTIFDALVRLQQRLDAEGRRGRPVAVRFLIDHRQLEQRSQSIIGPILSEAQARQLDPALVALQVAVHDHLFRDSVHQKAVVIDNKTVLVTGANVQTQHDWYRLDEQGNRVPFTPWRDAGFVFHGEVARAVRADFAALWPTSLSWSCDGFGPSCSSRNGELPPAPNPPMVPVPGPGAAEACTPVIALTQRPYENLLTPNYNGIDSAQDQGWIAAMKTAQRQLKVQSPNLNDDGARRALLDAVERGIEVQLVLSKGFNDQTESLPGQGGTNVTNLDLIYAEAKRVLGDDVACQRLQARWYADESGRVIVDDPKNRPPGQSHVKYLSADGQLVIVGSGNMDTQSWNFSGEVNLAVDDARVTSDWDSQVFDPHFARGGATGHCSPTPP
jgi:phosphatidylserine/phosphatidylglycerophosphate/cardiolipin synthase-like enzyme